VGKKSSGHITLAPKGTIEDSRQTSKALQWHLDGESYEDVGARLGCSAWKAREIISLGYARQLTETADELRAAEELRLNELTKKLNDDLRVAGDQNTRNGIYGLLLKVSAERTRLLGLAIPPGTPDNRVPAVTLG
jgi:hypothetical protein